jgi:alpha-N-acetylglucosaminidase
LDDWLKKYALNRYRVADDSLIKAWQLLRETVYNGKDIRDGAESILTGRPTFDSSTVWTRTKLNYPPKDLLPVWDLFISAASRGINSDGFQFDLVDITRQILANYALPLQKKWVHAFQTKDMAGFKKYSGQFLQLISDMDALLAARKDFLLGPWIADARSRGRTQAEKALYERNARNLITLWGDANSPLHEYANRQWSGLLNDFYRPRWQQFFDMLRLSLQTNIAPDLQAFEKNIRAWEWRWVNEQKTFPIQPVGNSIKKAQQIYRSYRRIIDEAYE